MQLRKEILPFITQVNNTSFPQNEEWLLPEKILQFGTGVLLRGLPDYYVNKANRQGLFNGRIVVVKSTALGSADAFALQDCLYTHCIKGIAEGKTIKNYTINSSISRVLNANNQWQDILDCAANPQLQIILSNTTEVGITLLRTDRVQAAPPQSFPGKLLAFLYARYKAFNGSSESGMVIIPTELIVNNGIQLKEIVLQLARLNQLEESFIQWLSISNDFCNSLVDRIVPGALPHNDSQMLQQTFGYTDELAIMSEPYSLWAIETGNERSKKLLSFRNADKGIVITNDIQKFRELKLRLLNGTHTFSCGLAFLCHFKTVHAAMQSSTFNNFTSILMMQETIPCITGSNINPEEAEVFAGNVISRFSNPFIQHKWLAITVQYTSKIKQRCVPLIIQHYHFSARPPARMALGFAAYLLFMKAVITEDNKYYGERNGEKYLIQDDKATYFYDFWQNNNAEEVVNKALGNAALWGEDLSALHSFASVVLLYLNKLTAGADLEELTAL